MTRPQKEELFWLFLLNNSMQKTTTNKLFQSRMRNFGFKRSERSIQNNLWGVCVSLVVINGRSGYIAKDNMFLLMGSCRRLVNVKCSIQEMTLPNNLTKVFSAWGSYVCDYIILSNSVV